MCCVANLSNSREAGHERVLSLREANRELFPYAPTRDHNALPAVKNLSTCSALNVQRSLAAAFHLYGRMSPPFHKQREWREAGTLLGAISGAMEKVRKPPDGHP